MIFLVTACFALLSALVVWQFYLAIVKEEKFASERREWQQERAELLTRIQAPQAAPFMLEAKLEDAENDLPTLPTSEFDPQEVEKAREHLEEVGYVDGPVG